MNKEQFEEQLRAAYEKYEGAVHPSSWSKIESGLSHKTSGWKWSQAIGGLAIASGIALAGWGVWKGTQSTENKDALSNNPDFVTAQSMEQSSSQNPTFENSQNSSQSNEMSDAQTTTSSIFPSQSSNFESNHSGQVRASSTNPLGSTRGIEITQNTTALDVHKSSDGASAAINSGSNNLSNVRQTCAGTEVSFKPQSGPSDGSYLWNFGDGAFSSEPNPKHRFLKPGTYEVSLSVTDNKNAQINTVNMSETITILPNPTADFDWSFINGSKEAPTVEIKNLSSNSVSSQWNFADGSQSTDEHPIKSFNNKGSHSVMITAVNEYGCKDQRIKYININSDYNLNAPGSVICGEGFMPEGLLSAKGKISLTIYDGSKKIFETKSNKTPWYCSDHNGNRVEANKQYPWIAIIHDSKTGEDRYYSGAVLVKP